jgi:rare lipoprotein A
MQNGLMNIKNYFFRINRCFSTDICVGCSPAGLSLFLVGLFYFGLPLVSVAANLEPSVVLGSSSEPLSVAPDASSSPVLRAMPESEGGNVPLPAVHDQSKPAQTVSARRIISQGIASWYGKPFHGRRTANGERYDMHAMTAAHRTLPFGTRVRVKCLATGRDVVVRINDRGPYKHARVIDLSLAAARALNMEHRGVARVTVVHE